MCRGNSGFEVHLMNGAGRFITESTTTDENGRFAFARVAPGSYKLRVDAPEGYVFSGAAQDSVLPLESTRDGRGYSASFTMLGEGRGRFLRPADAGQNHGSRMAGRRL